MPSQLTMAVSTSVSSAPDAMPPKIGKPSERMRRQADAVDMFMTAAVATKWIRWQPAQTLKT